MRPPSGRASVSWSLVAGLGSLALLWPLAHLTGAADAVGQPLAAVLTLGVVALAWVAVVGLCRVPRPVLTLTLAGGAYGILLTVLALLLRPERIGVVLTVVGAAVEIGRSTALGLVAGLCALAVQRRRAAR